MLTLHFSGRSIPDIPLTSAGATLGRTPDNTIPLDSPGISRRHAAIESGPDGFSIVDLGSANGVHLNGKRVHGRAALAHGDRLRLDEFEIEVIDPNAATLVSGIAVDPNRTMLRAPSVLLPWGLVFKSGLRAGERVAVRGRLVIGRDESCDLPLDAPGVSRRHAELEVKGEALWIADLQSTNGAYVNGKRVSREIVPADAEIKIGDVVFTVSWEPSRAAAPSPGGEHTAVFRAAHAALRPVDGGARIEIHADDALIGREAAATVSLDDSSVSARHARLWRKGGGQWTIEDAGSRNGVWVNNKKVASAALRDGDRVRFGKVEFVFESMAARAPAGAEAAGRDSSRRPRFAVALAAAAALALAAWYAASRPVEKAPVTSGFKPRVVWSRALPGHGHALTPVIAAPGKERPAVVAASTSFGTIALYDLETGELAARGDIPGRLLAPPALADLDGDGRLDIVAATVEGMALAMPAGGPPLWRTRVSGPPGAQTSPALNDLNGDGVPDVIIAPYHGGPLALDGANGKALWRLTGEAYDKIVGLAMADLDGDGASEAVITAETGVVAALKMDRHGAAPLWTARGPLIHAAAPVILSTKTGALVVVATREEGVAAYDAATGAPRWRGAEGGRFFSGAAAVELDRAKGREVAAISMEGVVYALDGVTGATLWKTALGSPARARITAIPAKVKGAVDNLLALDMRGGLHLLSGKDGAALLAKSLAESALPFPAAPAHKFLNVPSAVIPSSGGSVILFALE